MKLFINRSILALRERESNLNFASSLFKKSFTLIELSIVLLILSLLVGSLLVGRQIVDRAKIQRIIFEFDYYEKAFHQFYDTYRAVPSAMTYKECLRHAEFGGQMRVLMFSGSIPNRTTSVSTATLTNEQFCQKFFPAVTAGSKYVLNGTANSKFCTATKLMRSGLIDTKYRAYDYANSFGGCPNTYQTSGRTHDSYDNYRYSIQSSFETENFISLIGFSDIPNYKYNDADYGFQQRLNSCYGLSTVGGEDRHELKNQNVAASIRNHNAIVIWNKTKSGDLNAENRRDNGNYNGANAAYSAKIASELDAKIDDGRPGSGKLIGLKSGSARSKAVSEDVINKMCFNKTFQEIDTAIYESSTDLKYGCNIMKIMEDVK